MKPITMYQSEDGSRWQTEDDAHKRDQEYSSVRAVMAPLGERVPGCDFANGSGFVQHTPECVKEVRRHLFELSRPRISSWINSQVARGASEETLATEIDAGWFMRLIDDNGPISNAWHRMIHIDALGREWGQPYFVEHPEKAQQVCLNPK